ncbi:MAG: flippase-like domain-containing protein [Candidatus Aenigmarchaeota archaeon]|nr:flippase-like domain-containing protein [Candidatus Aenigmarchaeota archaeon]
MRLAGHIAYIAAVVAILTGLVYYADPAKVAATLVQATPLYIALGFLVGIVSLAARVKKWAVLMQKGFLEITHVQLTGVMISNFTPGKLAEPVKAFILKATSKTDVSSSLPSIMWERIIDLVVVMILSLFVFVSIQLGGNLRLLSISGMAIFGFLALFALLAIYSQRVGRKLFSLLRKFPVLNRIHEGFIDNFYSTKISKSSIGKCFLWTFFAWILDSINFYIAFLALGISPPSIFILAGIVGISIIIAIASTLPGGIGSFEIIATVLLGVVGFASAVAVPVVFLFRIMTLWLSVAIGVMSMIYLGRKVDIFGVMKAAHKKEN